MPPALRPLPHRTPDASHINHHPYPRSTRTRQPLPKRDVAYVPLSVPFRLDQRSPLPSRVRQAEQQTHRSHSSPSRYYTPDPVHLRQQSPEIEVSESEETEDEPEDKSEDDDDKDRASPWWWYACLLLLLSAVFVLGLRHVSAAGERQPPEHPPPEHTQQYSSMEQCFRAEADMPQAPHLLPRGLRAPLSAMLLTLATDPDSALPWLLSKPMPFAAPALPTAPEYQELRVARETLHNLIRLEYGVTSSPQGSPLVAWWKRLQAPASLTTPSASHVAAVGRLPPSRLRRWACTWLPNDLTDRYLQLPCEAQARADSPLEALAVMLNLTTLARHSCTPGHEQSAADPITVAQTVAAAESVQELVLEQVARIAEMESHSLPHGLEDSSSVSWTDPTLRAAPWNPSLEVSRTGRSRHTMLSSTPRIGDTPVPSKSSERELNALAAVFAEAKWFQLAGGIIELINNLVTAECRQISSHAAKIQDEGLEQLIAAFRRPNANLSSSQLHHLAVSLLRLGWDVLIEKQKQPGQADAKYYALLKPLVDEEGVFNENLYSRGSTWYIGRAWQYDATVRYSRTALEKFWKDSVMRFGDKWGDERTSSQPETWKTCLRDMAGTASFHRDETLIAGDDNEIGLAQRLTHEAVWTFWHTGASPLWFTNAYPAGQIGHEDRSVGEFDRLPYGYSRAGKLYREDRSVNTAPDLFWHPLEVDLDLVWAWGRR